jgi:hypothetical protein
MAEVVSPRFDPGPVLCETCGGHSGTGKVFSSRTSVFPLSAFFHRCSIFMRCSSRHRAHWKGNVLSLGFKGLESRCVHTSVRLTGLCYMARKGGGEVAASARGRNIFLVSRD